MPSIAEVRFYDTEDTIFRAPIQLTNSGWTEVNETRITGESLIRKIQLVVSSGAGNRMAALVDFGYQATTASVTPGPTPNNSTSSSSATSIAILSFMLSLLMFLRLYRPLPKP